MNDVMDGWGLPFRFHKGASEYVPTWQTGLEADSGQDIANLMDAGYSKNSLIFACIEEIATSFAELPPQVLLPTDDGMEAVEQHELLDLLESPSETMDAYEFKATMAVHHRTAGNVYIEKVRQSESLDRNRSFGKVKELGLIRPDYVTIQPGQRRADDLFVVKVGGKIVKKLPRQDVIHIRTRNVINDFYGLSPIALLIYEGNVDTEMTKFDWAFFRNAGVPLGLLKTKTKPSPDETRQIKSAFRQAFSGVKKWFEIMILPAGEIEYQQLALPMKDMEMTETRAHVEARICSVFGVPPIIVGARVGLESAGGLTTTSIQGGQLSFWSETMSPFAVGIASPLTRELLSEYQTTATRGAKVRFDLSGVKALQEDNSGRLKTAQDLVKSGGWTVNEALESVGLPVLGSGDFYVRAINLITETPAVAQINGRRAASIAPDLKQVGNRRVPRERLMERAAAELETFFAGQAARVVSGLPKGKVISADSLLPAAEEALLLASIKVFWDEAVEQGWEIGANDLGVSVDFDPTDSNVRRLLEGAGDRIKDITDETRRQVQNALKLAREEGLSPRQTGQLMRDLPAFGKARARTVARTELATADNKGAAARYREAGVKRVTIFDGPDCGWSAHDDADFADGSTRTLGEFEAQPISHPNCVRSRAPVVEASGNGYRETKAAPAVAEVRCPKCNRLIGRNVNGGEFVCPDSRCKAAVSV